MRILITGSSGFVGAALQSQLRQSGHQVYSLVRSREKSGGEAIFWSPLQGEIERDKLEEIDAVIHLAGEPVVGRWTEKKKAKIYDSRVKGTQFLVETLASLTHPPEAFISASAIGYYGDREEEVLTEDSTKGTGFLANVADDWEKASAPLAEKGIRVASMRIGLVLGRQGGALQRMLLPFKLGLGGILGSGKQWVSWITIDDLVGAFHHVLMDEQASGAYNVVAPEPVTNYTFTKALGKALKRPTLFPVPAFVMRLIFGEMADGILLGSTRVKPARLMQGGYAFKHGEIAAAFEHLLGR